MDSESSSQINNQQEESADDEHRLLLNGTKFFRVKEQKDKGNFVATCMTYEGEGLPKQEYSASRQSHSNLTKHLKNKHPDVHKDYLKEVLPSKRLKLNQSKFELINLEEKQEATDSNILELCYTKFLPPSIVNGPFEKLITDLNSQIKVKTSEDLYVDIYKTVNEVKKELKSVFEKTSFLSLTATVMEIDKIRYLLIACFWLTETDLSREDALLSCKVAPSDLTPGNTRAEVKDIMTEYGIKRQQVPSVITNAIVKYNMDFEDFLSDPKNLCTDNYYVFSDEELVYYHTVDLSEDNVSANDMKLEDSIIHQILKFAIKDFVSLLKDKHLLHTHNQVFSKVNKIWNSAIKNSDVLQSILEEEVKGPSANIHSLYECINTIYCIQEKLYAIDTRFEIPTFADSEIIYLGEILKFLKIIKEAIQEIEYHKDGYYGHVAPVLTQIFDDLSGLHLMELYGIHKSLLSNYRSNFKSYLDVYNDNAAMFAGCFNPGYKRDWLPLEDRTNVKELCKKKVSDRCTNVPATKTMATTKPIRKGYVSLRPQNTLREKDNTDIEALEYFRQAVDSDDKLTAFPTIKKLFIEYNTVVCNPSLTKAVLNRSHILNNHNSKSVDPGLFNFYAIINAAKTENVQLENQLDEEEEEED